MRPLLRYVFGTANLVAAAVAVLGVFVGLPARWLPVDAGAAFVVVLLVASGVGLLRDAPWAARVTRIAATIVLAAGLLLVVLLGTAIGWLSGIVGPVGRGGAIVVALVVALVLPYLVLLPAAELVWLRAEDR